MVKHILFGTFSGGDEQADVEEMIAFTMDYLAARPWIEACVLHMEGEDLPPGPQADKTGAGGAEVVMEVWSQGDRKIVPEDAPFSCSAAYRVEEIVEKGSGRFPTGALPGVTMVSRVFPKDGLSTEAFRAGYDLHPRLALKVHVGMQSYVRNYVSGLVPGDAIPFGAIACLHFATDEDYTDRLYVDDDGRAAIAADVARFMDRERSTSMIARSFVLK